MSQQLFRIAAAVPPSVRAALLALHQPQFATICLDTITYAFRVTREFAYPTDELLCSAIARADGAGYDAFALSIAGEKLRSDGRRFTLIMSMEPGLPRAHAILNRHHNGITDLAQPFTFPVRFRRESLSNLSAVRRAA